MSIFTRIRRRPDPTSASVMRSRDLDLLIMAIAESQATLLLIAQRVASGAAEPGDEVRLRWQREITASYCARLDKLASPTGTGDDAEAWLRSISTAA